jgi:hypothetical protein
LHFLNKEGLFMSEEIIGAILETAGEAVAEAATAAGEVAVAAAKAVSDAVGDAVGEAVDTAGEAVADVARTTCQVIGEVMDAATCNAIGELLDVVAQPFTSSSVEIGPSHRKDKSGDNETEVFTSKKDT